MHLATSGGDAREHTLGDIPCGVTLIRQDAMRQRNKGSDQLVMDTHARWLVWPLANRPGDIVVPASMAASAAAGGATEAWNRVQSTPPLGTEALAVAGSP